MRHQRNSVDGRSALAWTAPYAAPATLLVLLCVLIFGRSGSVTGFVLKGQKWPDNSAIVMSLQLGTNGQGTLRDGSANFDVVAAQAASLWNNFLGSNVRLITTVNGVGPSGSGYPNGLNGVFFNDTVHGQAFGAEVLALTTTTFNRQTSTYVAVDMIFNNALQWDSFRGAGSGAAFDLRRAATHEFGHVLGLGHPDDAGQNVPAVMNSQYSGVSEALQQDDINGVQAIYGVYNAPTPTPTPTPVPLLGGQALAGAIAHIYSSPGEPVGHGAEATINASSGYAGAVYRRETDGVGRTLHRFIFAQNGVTGSGEWVFSFALPAGRDLADGTYDIVAADQASSLRPFMVASLESGYSTVGLSAQVVLQGVTYASLGGNLTAVAADFRITQSTSGSNPQFLAGQLRFNTPTISLPGAKIVNLSTRVNVGMDAAQAISGFVVRDPSAVGKQALVRVLGPALVPRGVTGVLADPVSNLYSGSTVILSNNDWAEGISIPSQAPIVQIGLEPPGQTESVLLNRYTDGPYTAIVSGFPVGGVPGIGVALVEVYDLEIGSAASLINVATRGQVGTGGNVMIAGFVIQGPGTKKVIVRAIGPSLAAAGVTGALQNPALTLYNSAGQVLGQIDDYGQNNASDRAAIAAKNLTPTDARESAIYKVLAPGAYTAIVNGVGSTTGIALVEVYDAD